jgi:hypothetical protein
MLNLLTAVTNITAYYPIRYALAHHDILTAGIVSFAACSSAISHLFESHKHDMWGFGADPLISYYLNRVDVLGVFLTVGRSLHLWYQSGIGLSLIYKHPLLVLAAGMAYLCNFLSEQDPGHSYFIPLHCIWHLSIFLLLERFLMIVM